MSTGFLAGGLCLLVVISSDFINWGSLCPCFTAPKLWCISTADSLLIGEGSKGREAVLSPLPLGDITDKRKFL